MLHDLPPGLEVIASTSCENGACPTLYRDPVTRDVYVQGYRPDGSESWVRIPAADWATLQGHVPR